MARRTAKNMMMGRLAKSLFKIIILSSYLLKILKKSLSKAPVLHVSSLFDCDHGTLASYGNSIIVFQKIS